MTIGKIIPFLIFFGIRYSNGSLFGETNGDAADVSFSVMNVIKLFPGRCDRGCNNGRSGGQRFYDADAARIL